MFQEREQGGNFGDIIAFESAAEQRAAFGAFIRARAKEKRKARLVKHNVLIEQDEQIIVKTMGPTIAPMTNA